MNRLVFGIFGVYLFQHDFGKTKLITRQNATTNLLLVTKGKHRQDQRNGRDELGQHVWRNPEVGVQLSEWVRTLVHKHVFM